MRKRKQMRRILSKGAGLMLAFSLIVAAFLSGAVPASSLTAQAAQGSEKAAADDSIWDKIKDNLPEIDLSEFDLKAEKEKFREAIRTLDEMGISPEKLAERAWNFLNSKDNKEIIDQTVEDIRDKVEDVTGNKEQSETDSEKESGNKSEKESGKDAGTDTGEESGSASESGGSDGSDENDVVKKLADEVGEAADQVTEEITDRASEKVEEAAGQVKEEVKKKAAEEIMNSF